MTEKEMREHVVPTLNTIEELSAYIEGLRKQKHDYGTAVYAMSLAAVAAFNYIAGAEGVTGFQASCADLDILRRTRCLEGPFMLIKLHDALFPQYNLTANVQEFIDRNRKWLREEAKKKLVPPVNAHPDVIAHWQQLAAWEGEE